MNTKEIKANSSLLDVQRLYLKKIAKQEEKHYHEIIRRDGDSWGAVNAAHKFAVKKLVEATDLPYQKEIGAIYKDIVTQDIPDRQLASTTVEDAIYNMVTTGYIFSE